MNRNHPAKALLYMAELLQLNAKGNYTTSDNIDHQNFF